MSHRVTALYHDHDKARLAVGDLQFSGVPADQILLATGLSRGSGRIEVQATSLDQAIDIRTFLDQDGAHSVEIHGDEDGDEVLDRIPTVPAAPL